MADENHTDPAAGDSDTREQLRRIFSAVKNPIEVYLFTQENQNDTYNHLAGQVLAMIAQINDNIRVSTYGLDHSLARQYNVTRSPTILFAPDKYNIRWLGAPVGEEGRTLVELLLLIGFQNSNLGKDAENILSQLDGPRHTKVFVSPSCPYCPQQAVNAVKAAVSRPQEISLEIIDIQAFPDIANQYDAQSVPQTFANEVLIAMGAQAEELFALSLLKMEQQNIYIPDSEEPEVEADVVIVGGGPAGLSAGIYAARSGLNAVILERGVLGGQVATTPVVENYPGMNQVGGKSLVDFMVSHALEYVRIFQDEHVMEVERDETAERPFAIKTNRRQFHAKAMLLATGAKHRKLDVPGEDRLSGRGVSYCSTCDGPFFKNQRVIMVGGGDSAATDALHLLNIGVDVSIVHWSDHLDAQDYLARQIEANHIPVLYNTEVREIHGKRGVEKVSLVNNKTGEVFEKEVEGVFIAIGYDPVVDLAQQLGVKLTPQGYIAHDNYRTSVPGIYTAGDVTGGFNQIVVASGQGSGAALTIFEDLIHPYWKRGSADNRPDTANPATG